MSHSFAEGEENALYNMGGLMQFGNDILIFIKIAIAISKPFQQLQKKMHLVRQLFIDQMNKSFALTKQLSYKAKKKKNISVL